MSVISGIAGAVASGNASDAQVKASEQAVQAQLQMYNQSRTDQYPWRTAGTNALNAMSGLMGMGYIPADTGATAYGQQTNALAGGYYQSGASIAGGAIPGGATTPEEVYNALFAEAQQTGDTSKVNKFVADYGAWNKTYQPENRFPDANAEDPRMTWIKNYFGGNAPTGTNALATGQNATSPFASGASTADAQAAEMARFKTSPGYEFRLGEGLKAIDRGAAARGGLQSGAAIKAEQRYGEGLAASEYGDYWNRLAAMSGVGQTSVQSTGQLGANTANQISGAYTNAGNARASGYINQANALSGASNSAVNALAYYNALSKFGNTNTAANAAGAAGASNMVAGNYDTLNWW